MAVTLLCNLFFSLFHLCITPHFECFGAKCRTFSCMLSAGWNPALLRAEQKYHARSCVKLLTRPVMDGRRWELIGPGASEMEADLSINLSLSFFLSFCSLFWGKWDLSDVGLRSAAQAIFNFTAEAEQVNHQLSQLCFIIKRSGKTLLCTVFVAVEIKM